MYTLPGLNTFILSRNDNKTTGANFKTNLLVQTFEFMFVSKLCIQAPVYIYLNVHTDIYLNVLEPSARDTLWDIISRLVTFSD